MKKGNASGHILTPPSANITALLELYASTADSNLGYLCTKYMGGDLASAIHAIHWDAVPFIAARYVTVLLAQSFFLHNKFLHASVLCYHFRNQPTWTFWVLDFVTLPRYALSHKSHAPSQEYCIVEAVMKWCGHHSNHHDTSGSNHDNYGESHDNVAEMLDCICWTALYPSYLNAVLLPYIRAQFPWYTESPQCTKHTAHPQVRSLYTLSFNFYKYHFLATWVKGLWLIKKNLHTFSETSSSS